MTHASRLQDPVTLAELEVELAAAGARLVVGEANRDARVLDVTQDSRRVKQGALFVARRGAKSDGTKFAGDALANGAAAVLCEAGAVSDVPRLEVQDLALAYGLAAHRVHGRPSEALSVVGVTGTNGKTTTACLLESALSGLGARPARLGTLGFVVDGVTRGGTLTTPQADDVARYMAEARDLGATHFVMEVSSHALDQGRVAGVRFAVGAFTNLTLDHLDYHGTMEAYGAAKRRLFSELRPAHSVINVDDAFGGVLAREVPDALEVSRAGERGDAGLRVQSFAQDRHGLSADILVQGERVQLRSRLVGLHNLDNLLVALGCLVSLGYAAPVAARALGEASAVPGRLERCDAAQDDVLVLVDYAHTPDALERVLQAVAGLTEGDLVCVFGCGGDRDRTKRPLMGRVAAALASRVIVTSDNPRSEEPLRIIDDILPGLEGARAHVTVQADRAAAIEEAILGARPGDVVLLAGKGHETYQLIGDRTLDFDDRIEARKALAQRRAARGGAR
jgi:UDP-N-acetylmuramoyl-L-alanyl-D-glutamate--2,6-diaminopimelate ligase